MVRRCSVNRQDANGTTQSPWLPGVREEGRQPSGRSSASGWLVLAKGKAESPLFIVMLFDSGPQPLVSLDAADHCVMRVCPRLTLSKGNST